MPKVRMVILAAPSRDPLDYRCKICRCSQPKGGGGGNSAEAMQKGKWLLLRLIRKLVVVAPKCGVFAVVTWRRPFARDLFRHWAALCQQKSIRTGKAPTIDTLVERPFVEL